jgi:hypothetical protein
MRLTTSDRIPNLGSRTDSTGPNPWQCVACPRARDRRYVLSGKGNYSGASMHIVRTGKRKMSRRKYYKLQEQRWARRSGPVTIRKIGDPKPED